MHASVRATQPLYHNPVWCVYVLSNTGGFYVGISSNLGERLRNHRKGHTPTSARLGNPAELVMRNALYIGDYVHASQVERWIRKCKLYQEFIDGTLKILKYPPIEYSEFESYVLEYRRKIKLCESHC